MSSWEQFKAIFKVDLPIYVTRKSANGETASYSQTLWMTLLVQLLIWLNLVLWGGYGIYKFFDIVT